jgi:hypothetical protein
MPQRVIGAGIRNVEGTYSLLLLLYISDQFLALLRSYLLRYDQSTGWPKLSEPIFFIIFVR